MKFNYDYAAEMEKIASSEEHQKLYTPMEKLAFSRDGKTESSEVEKEFERQSVQKVANCECKDCSTGCSCDCHKDTSSADDGMTQSEDTSTKSALDAVSGLMKISMQLEEQGFNKLAAASLMLAEYVVKEAKKKKETAKSKSKSSDKSKASVKSKSSDKSKKETEKSKKDKDKKSTKKSK